MTTPRRRVLIHGYYGFQNTGDDALLACAVWGVRARFGSAASLRATAHRMPRFPGAGDVEPILVRARIRGSGRLRIHGAALRSDSVVFGGGSVFHRGANLRELRRVLWLAGKGRHAAVGVSVGPLDTAREERACRDVLSRLSFIGARDLVSARIVAQLVPEVPSALTFDLAPILPLLGPAGPRGSRSGIGVALCDYERFVGGDVAREAERRRLVGAVLRDIARSSDEDIVLIDFNGHADFGDARLHQELIADARLGARVRRIPYCDDPLAVLRLISGLRVILAMRLHAAVFGYIAETPVVQLSYHSKCDGWAEQIGLPAELLHDSSAFDPTKVAEQLLLGAAGRLPEPSLQLSAARNRALSNFEFM